MTPDLNEDTGELWLAPRTFDALHAHAASAKGPEDSPEQLASLRGAGVLDGSGTPHAALTPAMSALAVEPLATIGLSFDGRTTRVWQGSQAAAVLLPKRDDGRHLLTAVPPSALHGALAKLVSLGPRERTKLAEPVPVERVADGQLGTVRRHWRMTAVHPGAPAESGTNGGVVGVSADTVLEVVDADAGLWEIRPDGNGERRAWPSTPTRVWRGIVGLVAVRDGAFTAPRPRG